MLDQINLYGYVDNAPANMSNPCGRCGLHANDKDAEEDKGVLQYSDSNRSNATEIHDPRDLQNDYKLELGKPAAVDPLRVSLHNEMNLGAQIEESILNGCRFTQYCENSTESGGRYISFSGEDMGHAAVSAFNGHLVGRNSTTISGMLRVDGGGLQGLGGGAVVQVLMAGSGMIETDGTTQIFRCTTFCRMYIQWRQCYQ